MIELKTLVVEGASNFKTVPVHFVVELEGLQTTKLR